MIRPIYLPLLTFPDAEPEWKQIITDHFLATDVVIEVGANRGGSTFFLSKQVKFVFAFEADPLNFKILRAYSKHNSITNIKIENLAIGDSNGFCSLKLSKEYGRYKNSISSIPGADYGKEVRVPLAKLDSMDLTPEPTSIVLDCEGSEVSALKGCGKILDNTRIVAIETHVLSDGIDTTDEVIQLLRSHDFETSIVWRHKGDAGIMGCRSTR